MHPSVLAAKTLLEDAAMLETPWGLLEEERGCQYHASFLQTLSEAAGMAQHAPLIA